MKVKLQEKYIMNIKIQRDVLLSQTHLTKVDKCAPPSYIYQRALNKLDERISLCNLKGSLTVEAAMILPFFMMILISFFSFFSKYASAAELKNQAAAEAKHTAITMGTLGMDTSGDVTIYKTAYPKDLWINPFYKEDKIVESAVCRPWIGFTELENLETYVYITPEGSVYHLFSDCTHLKLSIRQEPLLGIEKLRNLYGEKYYRCELCREDFGILVYVTSEGNRYHGTRTCSGLKRTIRQVPMSQVMGRSKCLRCSGREME